MIVNFCVFLSVPACRHRAPYSPDVSLNPNSDISISSTEDTADKSFSRWRLPHRKSNRLNGHSPSRFFSTAQARMDASGQSFLRTASLHLVCAGLQGVAGGDGGPTNQTPVLLDTSRQGNLLSNVSAGRGCQDQLRGILLDSSDLGTC